jgi:hypothetical protein
MTTFSARQEKTTDMKIKETYVNRTEGHIFGDSGWYEPWTDDRGELFRSLQKEFGRCESRIYIDTPTGTRPSGWVFVKRDAYEGNPRKGHPSYIREVWVEVTER